MQRVLVLGGSGMLGHALVPALADAGHRVFATLRDPWSATVPVARFISRDQAIDNCHVAQDADLARAISLAKPAVIVNCVGVIKQKEGTAGNTTSVEVNALLPHRVADQATRCGAKLIQISTDCVYSGRKGMYTESDPPDPPDFYGRSKLLGEVFAPHLTLRTSLVGWQVEGAESLFNWFLTQRGKTVQGFANAYFSGLTTYALATLLQKIVTAHPGLSGLYHVAAPRISKLDLLVALNDRLGHPCDIAPNGDLKLDRSLNGYRFLSDTGITPPDWPQMLDELCNKRVNYNDDRPKPGR